MKAINILKTKNIYINFIRAAHQTTEAQSVNVQHKCRLLNTMCSNEIFKQILNIKENLTNTYFQNIISLKVNK